MTEKIKLLAFVPELGGGGAEMHLIRVLNHLDPKEFDVVVVVARSGGSYESKLREHVRLEACTRNVRSSVLSMYASIPKLRRMVQSERPDIVISLLEHSSVALYDSLRGLKNRPLLCLGIQNNFTSMLGGLPPSLRLWYGWQIRNAYASADQIIALSQGVAEDLISHVPKALGRVTVIYNAGFDRAILNMAREPLNVERPQAPLFVACGRLVKQKDYPTLLRAFARLRMEEEPNLWILGRGPEESELKNLARDLGIADKIIFLGYQDNPFKYMARADVFVLSSAWEGFGNVIVEALALGLPVVCTDCPFGPSEILNDGEYGDLVSVGDVAGLANAMKKVYIRDDLLRLQDIRKLRAEDFEAECISTQYAEKFQCLLGRL